MVTGPSQVSRMSSGPGTGAVPVVARVIQVSRSGHGMARAMGIPVESNRRACPSKASDSRENVTCRSSPVTTLPLRMPPCRIRMFSLRVSV